MVQAARSGKQNIAAGAAAATSGKKCKSNLSMWQGQDFRGLKNHDLGKTRAIMNGKVKII